ncbi:MAG: amidohydrolase family protein [Deltaproteobacteria bacterium]|nr:amidohydrolase family protein [Deltaproteobacteria bacterium]
MRRFLTVFLVMGAVACSCNSHEAESGPAASATGAVKGHVWHLGRPVIDSHVHIFPTMVGLETALKVFDRAGIGRFAVKSGGSPGSAKYRATMAMQKILKGRMRVFSNIRWSRFNEPGFVDEQVRLLEKAKKDGVVGIKIFKALGLKVRNADGSLVKIDDPRLDPIFAACGRLGLIVAWHVADPVAFFQPVTPENERYDELKIAEDWSFYGKDFPSHDELLAARDRVIERHPETVFLLIHMANYPERLDIVDKLLDTLPNVYVDTSARVPEIGRHPAKDVRAFFIKHQDRILFGSDFISGGDGNMQLGSVWYVPGEEPDLDDAEEFYERHWRYFETDQKQMEHPTPIQGRWKVDGIKLPPDVLQKLYVTNAEKLIFSGKRPQPYKAAK